MEQTIEVGGGVAREGMAGLGSGGEVQNWQALAMELGFTFKPGVQAFMESPTALRLMAEKGMPQQPTLLNNPMVQAFLAQLFLGVATGNYKGYECFAYRSSDERAASRSRASNQRAYYVNMILLFKKPLPAALKIRSITLWDKLWCWLRRKPPITIVPELDRLVVISGLSDPAVQQMLGSVETQKLLSDFFSNSEPFKLDTYGVRHKESGRILPKERVLAVMDKMVALAERLQ